ncbi:hypothetical protein KSD_41270 [Ktedonobacter sp. SOSP1-85]|uniref:ATP-binding protein n=1 Tax=Ktedonobacter sp. SOSP1-85 TaxID=2778367 RepID=UPI00191549D4|nr:ATP-binding protein [Ktedonobacter sp. SOSP1-85]GHO76356.1 hypothetical protein KSD_41270 [Ktedonobacter sp. SOSP1-85]
MDDGSTYNIENDGLMQGSIFGGRNHNITQNFYPPAGTSMPPERAWNIPYQRNPYFTGREDLLTRLHKQLHAGQDIALSQAISGLGGVGKTQLVVEYAYRYRQEYRYILWARAESEESLISSYVALAHLLNLPQKDAQDQHLTVQALKHWLQNNGGWLLILDNADEPKILSPTSPQRPRATASTLRAPPPSVAWPTACQSRASLTSRAPSSSCAAPNSSHLMLSWSKRLSRSES